jgi:hypothetical protein
MAAINEIIKLWKEGAHAEIRAVFTNIVAESVEVVETDVEHPQIEYREYPLADGKVRKTLRLALPPPTNPPFDTLLKAAALVHTFVDAFARDDLKSSIQFADLPRYLSYHEYEVGDGFAVLESFVKLCMALYGAYSTRGIDAYLRDSGGDYPAIELRATWLG